jgi:formylglycine-generating enzyme required for sulfatase activity
MQLEFDQLGFPLVRIEGLGLSVALLPITKVQFERFIAEPNSHGDTWYDEILGINPRLSWRRAHSGPRERLFLTGALPSEALAFASWAGIGLDLPTVEEWRAVFRYMIRTRLAGSCVEGLDNKRVHPAARAIVELIVSEAQPKTWGELALLRGGVIEWVREDENFKGLGAPRPQFLPSVFNPERDEPLFPLQDQRSRYFGFRLLQRRTKKFGRAKS